MNSTDTDKQFNKAGVHSAHLDVDAPLQEVAGLEILRKASKLSGRGEGSIFREIISLSFGQTKLSDYEYFKFRLYDNKLYSREQKREFIGNRLTRKLQLDMIFDRSSPVLPIIKHKLFMERLLNGFGFPTTNTIACYADPDAFATMGNMKLLRDQTDLSNFLKTTKYPIFGKPMIGSLSLGAAGFEKYDLRSQQIILSDKSKMSLETLHQQIDKNYRSTGYLFQRKIIMHPDLQRFTGNAVGCFRVVCCKTPDGIRLLYALWKIPMPGSMADNFWRKSRFALIDIETGTVVRCQMGHGPDAKELEVMPESGIKIKGLKIPNWASITELAFSAASFLSEASILGFDIALSDSGPIIIEVNGSPEHGNYQLASGKGLLTPENRKIFDFNIARAKKNAKAQEKLRQKSARGLRKQNLTDRMGKLRLDLARIKSNRKSAV